MNEKCQKPLVSIIVPVYNVSAYLDRCIKSIIGQTYRDIEILLVDDGSTDGCGSMCDRYATEDDRIFVFHKTNGGLSDARNYGMERAKGEYFVFVDSDDYITADAVEYMLSLVNKYGVKLSVSANTIVQPSGKIMPYGTFDGDLALRAEDAMERLLYDEGITVSAWAKMYHRSLFESVQYPAGKSFEDAGTTYKLIMQCNDIALGGKSTYYYIRRSDSIVTSVFKESKLDLLEMTDNMCDAVEQKWSALSKAVLRRRIYSRFSTLNQMLDTDLFPEKRREIVDFIKKNAAAVKADKRAPKRDKMGIFMLQFGFKTYRMFWKIYIKMFK